MMKFLSFFIACFAIAGVTPFGEDDANSFRKDFFDNLDDPAYLLSNDNEECYTQSVKSPQICQNFKKDAEFAINGQINLEFYASYLYNAMATYFERVDVAHFGFSKFFKKASDEERQHAIKLQEYQTKRGGTVHYYSIKAPHKTSWSHGLEAMEDALDVEKRVNKALLQLHQIAQDKNDPHLQDFLETHYLEEQVESIKEFGNYVQKLRRLRSNDPGIGEYMFDQELK